MLKRFVAAITIFMLWGCVAKGEFLQKQAEADRCRQELGSAAAENSTLREQVAELRLRELNLVRERDELVSRLSAQKEETERLTQSLRHRIMELEGDRQMLEEGIALLKKTKEEAVQKVSRTYENLLGQMKEEIAQGQITITELKGRLTVDVVEKILFDSGRAEIKPEGLAVLKRVVEILKTVDDKVIRVEGHTDNVPISGSLAKRYPTNWELAAARAINVTRYLEKEGIDPALLSAASFGEHQPIADNETPEGRAKNRRIAIILLSKESGN